jgi:hypothetical protein
VAFLPERWCKNCAALSDCPWALANPAPSAILAALAQTGNEERLMEVILIGIFVAVALIILGQKFPQIQPYRWMIFFRSSWP